MAKTRIRSFLSAAGLLALVACGGQSTDTPTSLDVTTYPANQPFTMTLTMQACSDICAEYDEGSCSVDVDKEKMIIDVDASISWDRKLDAAECPNRCGPPVKVTCDVEALDAGVYTLEANGFTKAITIR